MTEESMPLAEMLARGINARRGRRVGVDLAV